MGGREAIQCHTCGADVRLARSVSIHPLPAEPTPEKRTVADLAVRHHDEPEDCWNELDQEIQAHIQRMSFEQHTICDACYRALDSGWGACVLQHRNGTRRSWGIAAEGRGNQAAIHVPMEWRETVASCSPT